MCVKVWVKTRGGAAALRLPNFDGAPRPGMNRPEPKKGGAPGRAPFGRWESGGGEDQGAAASGAAALVVVSASLTTMNFGARIALRYGRIPNSITFSVRVP
jgi:hypothetical protein